MTGSCVRHGTRVALTCLLAVLIACARSPNEPPRAPVIDPVAFRSTVSIHIDTPSASETSKLKLVLWLERADSQEVSIFGLEPGQDRLVATLQPGTYRISAWLDDYRLRALFRSPEIQNPDPLQRVTVGEGQTAMALQVDAWTPSQVQPLALRGRLIDGTGVHPQLDEVVVVVEDRIVAVGTFGEVPVPATAIVIELPGATILPGLINTHVHNSYNTRNLRAWAQAGVTTVRDFGERLGVPCFSLRERLRTDPQNSWLISAGPLVTVPDGYPIVGNRFPSLTVTSPEDARKKVNQLIDDGADVIKIVLTSGGPPTLSAEEAAAIVETAHRSGVPVTVHATSARDIIRALDAGVDDVAHLAQDPVSDEILRRMVSQEVCWVPTLEALDGAGADNLRRFVQLGGCVAMGNDGGYLQGLEVGLPLREIHAMTMAGMSPMQVLVAATQNAARVCRRSGSLGAVQPGKFADLLVVDGDPLQDLAALEHVRLVLHKGAIIRDER
jgi:enamidase